MITVHHLNHSRSTRVLWLLEELELPYEIVRYERNPTTMLAPDSLKAVHPLGKSPVITDDGATIAESGNILEHLADAHGGGRFVPTKGTQAYHDCRYFMHYAEGSLMPYLLLRLIFSKIKAAPVPFFIKPITKKIASKVSDDFVTPNLVRALKFIGDHLENHTWFAGDDLSIADMQMSYAMEAIADRCKDLPQSPKFAEYVARMRARPAYKRAVDKGGSAF